MDRSTRSRGGPSARWPCWPAVRANRWHRRSRICAAPAWWCRRWHMFDVFTGPMLELFATSLWETIVMVGISGLIGAAVGVPLGVYLHLTDTGGVLQNRPANRIVGAIVNAVRSTPFIILLVAI